MHNYEGYTPLLLALKFKSETDFIISLLDAKCNVSKRNNKMENALHIAIKKGYSVDLIAKIIDHGADIDAQEVNSFTPLYEAVYCNRSDVVYMLLYYGVDVYLTCHNGLTPLMYSLTNQEMSEISKILFYYYDDFSTIACDGYTTLLLAINSKHELAIDLVKADADVNVESHDSVDALYLALFYPEIELFKEIFKRVDFNKINRNILYDILKENNAMNKSRVEWLDILYTVLESEHVKHFLETPKLLLAMFIEASICLNLDSNDRLAVICSFLSYGYYINDADMIMMYNSLGLKEEFDILVQLGFNRNLNFPNEVLYPLPALYLGIEKTMDIDYILELYKTQLRDNFRLAKSNLLVALKYFSFSPTKKEELLNAGPNIDDEIKYKISLLPEFPSLMELSRNVIRASIRRNSKHSAYKFHDLVQKFSVPCKLQNIILFKTSVYD